MSSNPSPEARSGIRSRGAPAGLAEDGWNQIMVRRPGAPPLRFKGREMARYASACSGSSITLWKRKTKGYVATVDAGEHVESASVGTLDDLMTWLEQACRPPAGSRDTIGAFLNSTPARHAAARGLRVLAGRALDDLDRLSDQASATTRKDTP